MHERTGSIPSGVVALDEALGCGGYPRGRIVEIFGPASCGKTSIALRAVAAAQRAGGTAAFIDVEHALDPGYAAALGVDTQRLIVVRPERGEEAIHIAAKLIDSLSVDLVVMDSAAALAPAESWDTRAESTLHMRLLEQGLRKLSRAAVRARACLLFVNQLRVHRGYGGYVETTAGGNALKLAAAVRVDVRRRDRDRVAVRIVKNSLAAAFRTAVFALAAPPAYRTEPGCSSSDIAQRPE